jgi:hypothetical protein
MIKYLQLPFYFDVQKMQDEVQLLGDTYWKLHFQVKHYVGDWSAIPLRSIGGDINNGFISPIEGAMQYQDTNLLNKCIYLKEVLQQFKCKLLAVRLLKLTVGTQILPHKDADLCYEEGLVRLHIPIITSNEIDFFVQDEKMNLQEGECWYMNLNLLHSVHNKSNKDRVHLVIDAEVNNWITEMFASPSIKNKKEIANIPKHTNPEIKEMILHLRNMQTDVGNKLADEMEKQLH